MDLKKLHLRKRPMFEYMGVSTLTPTNPEENLKTPLKYEKEKCAL